MAHDPLYGFSKFADDASAKFDRKYPHAHVHFSKRPDVSRRAFFKVAGAGVAGSFLLPRLGAQSGPVTKQGVTTKNTAKYCIIIQLQGAISHLDTFDFKPNSATPSAFGPTTINGVSFPAGYLPKLAAQMPNLAIVRSMSAWALVHSIAQTWWQIGRNPVAALGDIAPNIGSVIALEKDPQRVSGQVFPAFVALNTPTGPANGYFAANYAPFRVNEPSNNNTIGVIDTTNATGQTNFNAMYKNLHALDDSLRINSPYGQPLSDFNTFYTQGTQLMYNQNVTSAFNFSAADSQRYGSSQLGNACIIAKQILQANQGTRAVQITYGSWDMHTDIYGQQNPKGSNMLTMGPVLDNAVGTLLADLQTAGLLSQTLVVMQGEFGRTPGVNGGGGRDHFLGQTCVFAGAGIKGGKAIGTTSADGSAVTDFGWNGSGGSGGRFVRPEDVEATIYDAMGIDWTTIRQDDPYHRGFEYVPFGSVGTYGPINELWT